MSKIHLRREHDLTRDAARRKVERLADLLGTRFGAACTWDGDVLAIAHPGITGQVAVREREIVVEATLGFMLATFRDRVDEELVRLLDREFPDSAA